MFIKIVSSKPDIANAMPAMFVSGNVLDIDFNAYIHAVRACAKSKKHDAFANFPTLNMDPVWL